MLSTLPNCITSTADFQFGHAIVGAVKEFTRDSGVGQNDLCAKAACLGKLVDTFPQLFDVGDDQTSFAATDDFVGGDA